MRLRARTVSYTHLIYQISAVKARCNYLIRAIKERGAPAETAPAAPARAALAEPEGKEGAVWT